MPTKSDEQKAAEEAAKRALAREGESTEQKWMRSAIREAVEEVIDERLAFDDKPKPAGGGGFFEQLLGKKPA